MFSKTRGLVLLTLLLLLLLLSVSSVCAADDVSAVNVSDNVSGNISEANVSETNVSNISCSSFWTHYLDSLVVVDPPKLSGSDGDFINFAARVYYLGYNGYEEGFRPIYGNGQCFGRVSLYEDGKLIDSVILSEDNDGTASFSFMFKEGHRYRLVYHGYSSPDHGFLDYMDGKSYYYKPSSKDLNIKIVHRLFDNY